MRRKTWFIIIVLVGLLGVGVYAFCIPCQFFGYKRLPSAEEVLANPSVRPAPITEILQMYVGTESICAEISYFSLADVTPVYEYASEYMTKYSLVDQTFRDSVQIRIDGTKKNTGVGGLLVHHAPRNACTSIEDLDDGHHVAQIEFDDPYGTHYSYTWVFEVTGDDVVPEVTATVGP